MNELHFLTEAVERNFPAFFGLAVGFTWAVWSIVSYALTCRRSRVFFERLNARVVPTPALRERIHDEHVRRAELELAAYLLVNQQKGRVF